MKNIRAVLICINSLCMLVLLFAFSFQLYSFGEWFYRFQFRRNGTYEVLYERWQVDEENLHYVARRVIDYLSGRAETLDDTTVMAGGQERLFFTELEACHMYDVWVLFNIAIAARNVAAVWFLATLGILLIWSKTNIISILKRLFRYWRGFALFCLACFALLGILIAIDFDRAFDIFHEILFVDNWTFNPRTSLMINMLPNEFFQSIAAFIIITFLSFLAVISVIPAIFRRIYGR